MKNNGNNGWDLELDSECPLWIKIALFLPPTLAVIMLCFYMYYSAITASWDTIMQWFIQFLGNNPTIAKIIYDFISMWNFKWDFKEFIIGSSIGIALGMPILLFVIYETEKKEIENRRYRK